MQSAKANPDHLRLLDAVWELHDANAAHTFIARMVMHRFGARGWVRFPGLGSHAATVDTAPRP